MNKDNLLLIIKIGVLALIFFVIGILMRIPLESDECSFSLLETTPVGYDAHGMVMSDGSIWGGHTENMNINHTYIYAKCDMYDGSCACPKGTTGPYVIKEIAKNEEKD